jgi:uncharacterized protein YjbI with pentapeptide repeats
VATKPKKEILQTREPADLPRLDALSRLTADGLVAGQPVEDALAEGFDISGRKISAFGAKCSLFREVSFANCEFGSIRLRDVCFEKCDLSNSVLRGFEATRVEFIDCRLIGMRAIECRWSSVLVENCEARYIQLNDGQARVCEVRGSNLAECDLRNTDLEGTIFSQALLYRADLTGAKLRGADLRGADIEGVTVRAEDLRGAIVNAAQAMDLARLLGVIIK